MNSHTLSVRIAMAAGTLAMSGLILSCADDDFYGGTQLSDDRIAFRATVSEVWQNVGGSRGDVAEAAIDTAVHRTEMKQAYKLECEGAGDPLYIFEEVSDSFQPAMTDQDEDQPGSRGAKIDGYAFKDMQIGVYAYFRGRPETTFYMRNVCYGHNGDYWHSKELDYLWPVSYDKDYPLQFFAYAPYNRDNTGKNGLPPVKIDKVGDEMKLSYSVPDSLDDQLDLLVCDLAHFDDIKEVSAHGAPLTFRHALTSVRFTFGAYSMYPGTITNVTLRNVAGKGVYDVTKGEWEPTKESDLRDFSFKVKVHDDEQANPADHVDDYNSLSGDILGTSGFTLMMIPQVSPEREGKRPVVEITFYDDATRTKRVYAKELDLTWKKGESVCYNISKTDMFTKYTFRVDVKNRDIYACGNEGAGADNQPQVKVTSYYTVYQRGQDGEILSQGRCPARWKSVIMTKSWNSDKGEVTDNSYNVNPGVEEDTPSWFITADRLHGNGKLGVDDTVTTVPIELMLCEHKVSSQESDVMKSDPKTYTDFDLSMRNGSMNTANCYWISKAGTYRIPLVYGNAIKDGMTNEKAYKYQGAETSGILHTFLRHDNRPIEDPWITKNRLADGTLIKPTEARLVRFQSIMGSPKYPSTSGEARFKNIKVDGDYLTFKVDGDGTLYPGNALIAVYAGNQILWTWHIWITGNFVNDPDPTTHINGYDMLDYALGELNGDRTEYVGRELNIEISQIRVNATIEHKEHLTFKQQGFVSEEAAQTMYYQFGRMHPMYASLFRTYIDNNGVVTRKFRSRNFVTHLDYNDVNFTEDEVHEANSIGYVLSHPKWLFQTGGNVYTGTYRNVWNNGTISEPIKTVYDPCPPGYMVPPSTNFLPMGADGWHFQDDSSRPDYFKAIYNNSAKFARGVLMYYIRKDDKGTHLDANAKELGHNAVYTSYWTGNYDSSNVIHVASISFDNAGDIEGAPKFKEVREQKSLKPSYMAAIRPVREK